MCHYKGSTGNNQAGAKMYQRVPVCPAILSIIGWHAAESPEDIVQRKRKDVETVGRTVWVYQSWKARVKEVQAFGTAYPNPTVYFLEGGAFPAGTAQQALRMSPDQSNWEPLPKGMGKVTGKLPGGGLCIGDLAAARDLEVDLWEYCEHPGLQPLRFQQGASTACVIPAQNGPTQGMKSRIRRVVAIGCLVPPYAVFLC
jgi:hypothetical protein